MKAKILEKGGHLLPIQYPEDFASALISFIKE